MNDLVHASTLFLIFATLLVLYGAALANTGNKDLLPYRARHSIRTAADVIRVGVIVERVGAVIGLAALLLRFVAS